MRINKLCTCVLHKCKLICAGIPCCRLPGLELRLRLLLPGDMPAAPAAPFIGPALTSFRPALTFFCFRCFLVGPMLSSPVTLLNSMQGCLARYLRTKLFCIEASAGVRKAVLSMLCLASYTCCCFQASAAAFMIPWLLLKRDWQQQAWQQQQQTDSLSLHSSQQRFHRALKRPQLIRLMPLTCRL